MIWMHQQKDSFPDLYEGEHDTILIADVFISDGRT